ncbi:exo-alpha-sialidase [Candidatus Poribacteria bacterium]|nr:exo-alpha-sialidase [Candidatus Poribacteria bacterium]
MKFNEIKYQNPATKTYLGSPSIIRLDNGSLLGTHDYFGPGCPKNYEGEEGLTSVYRSDDDGKTWVNVTHIMNAFWGNLFKHKGSVYLLSSSQQYGSIVTRRSDDNGNTWTHPADGKTGLLFKGGPFRNPPNYHCAPMPMLYKDGRIYRAFEDCTPCNWGIGFQSSVISVDEDADLLNAENWTISNKLPYDPGWTPKEWGKVTRPGWLEGNVVETPDGEIWNILRFNSTPVVDKAAIVKVFDEGKKISFDPETGFIDFPGGMTKFSIRRDPVTNLYLTLSNNNTDPKWPSQRNVLSLHVSKDLIHWKHVKTLLKDDQDISYEDSMKYTGFQYVDWQFDGDDIIYMVRMAYGGAHNFHDANRMTFHKLENFRDLLE